MRNGNAAINDCEAHKAELIANHKRQLDLCDRLERLADSLPDELDTQECLSISFALYPTIKAAHEFEEQWLFPTLLVHRQADEQISKSIERLQFEHWEDESFAEDLGLELRQLVSQPTATNVDKLSYMLRGFFEGLRRHIAFETDHIIPMLR